MKYKVMLSIMPLLILSYAFLSFAACGSRGQTFCSPLWGTCCCISAYVEGCWNTQLYWEYHSASFARTTYGLWNFKGCIISNGFSVPLYDDRGNVGAVISYSVSRSYNEIVDFAETLVAGTWQGEMRNYIISVTIGAGGWT